MIRIRKTRDVRESATKVKTTRCTIRSTTWQGWFHRCTSVCLARFTEKINRVINSAPPDDEQTHSGNLMKMLARCFYFLYRLFSNVASVRGLHGKPHRFASLQRATTEAREHLHSTTAYLTDNDQLMQHVECCRFQPLSINRVTETAKVATRW